MRQTLATVAAVLTLMGTAYGQTRAPKTSLPPPDYAMYGSLDLVANITDASAPLTVSDPIVIAGWVFECRSGLQPQTQRRGEFVATFSRVRQVPFGEIYSAPVAPPIETDRPDVVTVFGRYCPAMGSKVGFISIISVPPEPGVWTLSVGAYTTDSADRKIWWEAKREVVIQP